MKNLLLATALTIAVFTSSFATPPATINADVLANFQANFKNASNVGWVTSSEYVKADFNMDDQKMEVFFNKRGDIIATAKTVTLNHLPVFAKRAFAKQYSNYTVKQAIHMDTDEESCYYLAAENDKQTLIFKVNDMDQLTIFKTITK